MVCDRVIHDYAKKVLSLTPLRYIPGYLYALTEEDVGPLEIAGAVDVQKQFLGDQVTRAASLERGTVSIIDTTSQRPLSYDAQAISLIHPKIRGHDVLWRFS